MSDKKRYDPYMAKKYFQDSLGDLVEEKKKSSRISQEGIAKEMHLDKGTFSRYLNSKSEANISSLALIAEYFDVSTDFLLGRTENRTPKDDVLSAAVTTGLSDESILAIQKLGRDSKAILDFLLTYPELDQVLLRLLPTAGEKIACNLLCDSMRESKYCSPTERALKAKAIPAYELNRWQASRLFEKMIDSLVDSVGKNKNAVEYGANAAKRYLSECTFKGTKED